MLPYMADLVLSRGTLARLPFSIGKKFEDWDITAGINARSQWADSGIVDFSRVSFLLLSSFSVLPLVV
jgi:hypothetical protein